jgi:DNA-binding MarR family transcriptional regulator
MQNKMSLVYDLMWRVRKFTRTTLLHQHVISQHIGLHATDAECIDFLMEMGPSTAGALAKAARLTTGAMTNVIDRLEAAGFVRRNPDPADRRKVVVSYIPEKHHEAKAYYAALAKAVETLLSKYNKEELEFLVNHTEALTEIYNQQVTNINKS